MTRSSWAGVLGGLGCALAGCASHPAPTNQLASSLAAVRGAEEAGALNVPEAALHLKLAEEQIAQAKQLVEHDDNERAEDLAVRAYQDADLALVLTREAAALKRLETFKQMTGSGGEQPPQAPPAASSPSSSVPMAPMPGPAPSPGAEPAPSAPPPAPKP